MRKIWFLLILLLAFSCGKDKGDDKPKKQTPVKSVTVSKQLMMLGTGVEYRLTAISDPAKEDVPFTWISDDPTVASVSESGVVTALKVGETTIRAQKEEWDGACRVVVCPAPQAVDLGLSGIKWASMNIGATSEILAGRSFHWAGTLPTDLESKTPYIVYLSDENNNPYQVVTKYCQTAKHGNNGYTDVLTTLQAEDDAATQILGAGWRIPTKDEFNQLWSNCTWTWDSARNSYKIASKKNASNYIYLPVTGHPNPISDQDRGYYWSSNVQTSDARGAYYYEIGHVNSDVNYDLHTVTTASRTATYYIRAVKTY